MKYGAARRCKKDDRKIIIKNVFKLTGRRNLVSARERFSFPGMIYNLERGGEGGWYT